MTASNLEESDYSLSSGYYYLSSDITTTKTITIPEGSTVYLTLNGYVIDGEASSSNTFSVITVNGTLNLYGSDKTIGYATGEGMSFAYTTGDTNSSKDNYYAITGGLITGGYSAHGSAAGGGITVAGTLNMYSGTIAGNYAYGDTELTDGGGGVSVNGEFNMYGGQITGNQARREGGGVFVSNNSTFTLYGGTISQNKAGWGAGVMNFGTFTMKNGYIINNTAERDTSANPSYGGGVHNEYTGTFTMTGGEISGNSATYGGGLYNENTFEMSGGKIDSNTATANGAGVYSYDGEVSVSGTAAISSNTTQNSGDGGGIYAYSSEVNVSEQATISLNISEGAGEGGGISAFANSTVTITGGTISENSAKYGGGVFATASTVEISGETSISLNTATYSGGGIAVYVGSQLTISESVTISDNKSSSGGGVCVDGSTFTMTGGKISGNDADWAGGVDLTNSATMIMSGGEISGNTADYYNGVVLYGYSELKLSDDPIISGNTGTNGVTQNVVVCSGGMYISSALTDGASIGVAKYTSYPTVTGTSYTLSATDELYITADDSSYKYAMNAEGTAITAQLLEDDELEIDSSMYETFKDYYSDTYSTYSNHSCSTLSNAQPILGTEVYSGVQYYIIGSVDTSGKITGVEKVVSVLTSGNYYLAADLTPTQTITIESGQTVSLCLNGKDITAQATTLSSYSVITVNGTFNLYDCTNDTAGSITGGTGNIISSYPSGGGVYVDSGASFNMFGGKITGNELTPSDSHGGQGAGIYGYNSTIKIYGGEISNNTVSGSGYGGGIYSAGILGIYGGEISENTAPVGGGIFSYSTVTVEPLSQTDTIKIKNNTATNGAGGGIWSSSTVYLYGGEISGNTARTVGGGVYCFSEVRVSGAPKVTSNTAGESGNKTDNNVYVTSNQYITIGTLADGAKIGVTKAGNTGKVVYIYNETVTDDEGNILYFTSDNADYQLSASGDYLYIANDGTNYTIKSDIKLDSVTYNGKAQMPTISSLEIYEGSDSDKLADNASVFDTLTYGTDFTVTWFTNSEMTSRVSGLNTTVEDGGMINAGTYYGKISGAGEYAGTINGKYIFTINKEEVQIILSESSATYNGTAQKPTVTVKGAASNEVINEDEYTITWESEDATFVDAGTYSITAIATTNTNFQGIEATPDDGDTVAIKTYTINQKSITSSDISASNKDANYTISEAGDIKISVTESSNTLNTSNYSISWQHTSSFASGATLADYTVPNDYAFEANGVYVATITGTGNYKDSVTLTFKNIGDKTMPIVSVYESYTEELSEYYFSQWHGVGQTFVFYAEDDKGTGASVVGMDYATLTINASGVAEKAFEFTDSIINQTSSGETQPTFGKGYLDMATGTIYLKNASDENYANATDSTDNNAYTEGEIDTAIYFKAEVIANTADVGDTQILTTLTFDPTSVTIYNISFSATDANGNTSTTFDYNGTGVNTVTLSIDPRVDLFNGYYDAISTGFTNSKGYTGTSSIDELAEYFYSLDSSLSDDDYKNVQLVLEAYNYFEGRTTARQQRIAGVDFADGVTASNEISNENYTNLMKLYNAIDKETVADYVKNNELAQALKAAKDTADKAYNTDTFDLKALESAIDALEIAYNNTLVNGVVDSEIKSALEDMIGTEDIDGYIQDIEDYIIAAAIIPTLDIDPQNYIQLTNVINTWNGLSSEQQEIAEKLKTSDTSTFDEIIVSNTDSYTEIKADIDAYETAVTKVQEAISDNGGSWDSSIRNDIVKIIGEYQYSVSNTTTGTDSESYNLTADTITFLQITTVSTIETWIKNIEAIENVKELIKDAITYVNDHGSDDKSTTINEDLFIYNSEYIDGLDIKEYLIDTEYVATAYEDYSKAQADYDALVESNPELAGVIDNAGTTASEIKIDGPTNTTEAKTLVDVLAKYQAITEVAQDEGDSDKYTDDEIDNSITVNKLINSLDYSTSTVYDILYADYLYDNLGNAQDLIGSTNTTKLADYMALASEVYDGDFASTQSGGKIDSQNIAFDGYHGQDDYASDYIVGKIYNLASFEYNSGDLSDEEADAMIKEINQEIVQIIYGKTSVVEYEFNLSDSMDRYSQTFFNIHHIFEVGTDFYYVHDEYRSETGTYAGFWDFGDDYTASYDSENDSSYDGGTKVTFSYDTYSDTLTNSQQLIMNSVGTEYDYLLSLFTRLMEAHIAANNLPEDVLGDCEGTDHTLEEHYEDVEIAKMALERLSTEERRLLGEDLDEINRQYEALLEYMVSEDSQGITYSAQGEDVDGVSVFGLATQVDLSVLSDYDKGIDSIEVYVLADQYPEFDSVDIEDKSMFAGVNVLTAYNIKLIAETETETEEVQPAEDKKVVVIIPIPNDTLLSSITLYHIEDTGANAGAVNEITDKTYFVQDGQMYLSFTTTSFSDFVLIGDTDPDYVAPSVQVESTSSSGGSGTALDTHDPVITVDGEIATVYDANLKIITIDSNEYAFEGNTVVIDLSQFGNGTYKIYAADKYGRYATETVTVSSVKIAETVVAVEDEPEEVPVVAEAKEESGANFPWWILIVIAVCTATFIVYKKQKNKKENQ
ncbi:MAG: hypothetical protein R3Y45_03700 [Bacillota bacterium]